MISADLAVDLGRPHSSSRRRRDTDDARWWISLNLPQVVSVADKQKLALVCGGANRCVNEKDVASACQLLVEKQVHLLLLQLEVPTAVVRTMACQVLSYLIRTLPRFQSYLRS